MNKPVVVFGGSFNPPTNAHFGLAEQILNDYDIDRLLFMPVGDHYQKKDLLPAFIRIEMLREMCKELDNTEVSTIEVEQDKQLPTIETLELLQKQFPNQKLWFVLGTDNLRDLPNWDRYDDILSKFQVLVLERGEEKAASIIEECEGFKSLDANILLMSEEVKTNCSSTLIRKRLKEGKRVKSLIPSSVYQYIKTNQLYQ